VKEGEESVMTHHHTPPHSDKSAVEQVFQWLGKVIYIAGMVLYALIMLLYTLSIAFGPILIMLGLWWLLMQL
jgi:hypothetical protein